ncbi:3'(2'),5'-bisphosphate nucleotidase CysQ [Thermodesulforhabdus norvegica]|uniref:3'(2'),5'-bisphosphate nucleotidase CysQ n=1 Tax=Thermodesulforhabdus norvegica TaxID=39841 RepID=A0A1I4QI43_9BACT|nr:3'(2'),5'-bisphosphate nucleotidase CysQ [Thermodesulforhabdus norvegica]SFM39707.1 3'(2'), 5'-bisphosphate nucleotidase [Thermodesulforhabdus norvegica]
MITVEDERYLVDLCEEAAEAIMSYYRGTYETTTKEDRSPLTEADRASHRLIVSALKKRWPDIPVVSEEGLLVDFGKRKAWNYFWLVDPLDGTKEFIHGDDEFTVNIALIEGTKPFFGIVYVPVTKRAYIGHRERGAYLIQNGSKIPLRASSNWHKERFKVAVSRSHLDSHTRAFLEHFKDLCEPVVRGSSLKFCSVAEGSVDFYLRFGPTWEWDTAAGQAVVEAAGGSVLTIPSDKDLTYNKPDLKNGPFIVLSGREAYLKSPFRKWIGSREL